MIVVEIVINETLGLIGHYITCEERKLKDMSIHNFPETCIKIINKNMER